MCYASIKITKDVFVHGFGGNEQSRGYRGGEGGGLKERGGLFENCGFRGGAY